MSLLLRFCQRAMARPRHLLHLGLLLFPLLLPATDASRARMVVQSSANFPSYLDFTGAGRGSLEVTYDKRTPETWETALDAAVANGLNMVQVYVFWNYHRPTASGATDWHGEVGEADLPA